MCKHSFYSFLSCGELTALQEPWVKLNLKEDLQRILNKHLAQYN
jgi:hypothetical protein